jgi:hypothetical protein
MEGDFMTLASLRRALSVLAFSLLLYGCLPASVPLEEEEQPAEETAPAPEATSFAGKWKREDTGAVFEVEDAAGTVTGKLVEGSWVWKDGEEKGQEIFSKYTFKLTLKAGTLKGKATFAFNGEEETYDSKWAVNLEGTTLKAKVEELEFDDDGKVAKRTTVKKSFVFEPTAAPAAAPAAGGYKLDLTTMVQAPGFVLIGEDAAVGMKVKMETVAGGTTTAYATAIVGEDGDHWHVETDMGISAYASMSPDAKDMLIGMIVEKEGGKVTKAVLGKRGEAGKDIKVMAYTPTKPAEAPEGEAMELEVPAGTYASKLYTNEVQGKTYKSWVGTEGETEGVMLKYEAPDGTGKELSSIAMEDVDLGVSVEAKKLVYDNKEEMWMTTNVVVKTLAGGLLKSSAATYSMQVKTVAEDAAAELKWE